MQITISIEAATQADALEALDLARHTVLSGDTRGLNTGTNTMLVQVSIAQEN